MAAASSRVRRLADGVPKLEFRPRVGKSTTELQTESRNSRAISLSREVKARRENFAGGEVNGEQPLDVSKHSPP